MEKETQIIAFASLKGGVGKSTDSIITAANLAMRGSKILFWDFDTNNSATMYFTEGIEGIGDIVIKKNIFEMVSHNDIASNITQTIDKNIDIVPSSLDISKVRSCGLYELKNSLKTLPKDIYDYIIIDTAPNYDNILINIINIANLIITPVQLKKFNATTTKALQRYLYADCPNAIDNWYLLLNGWKENIAFIKTSQQEQYKQYFNSNFSNVLDVYIPESSYVNSYIEKNTANSISMSNHNSGVIPLAKAFNRLANMINGFDANDESHWTQKF